MTATEGVSRNLIQMEDALQHWYIMYLGQFVSGRLGLAHHERSFPKSLCKARNKIGVFSSLLWETVWNKVPDSFNNVS